ncbi:MAG: phosphate/phosphite/phosphonate ABC transporter substrate-binding protein [Cellvibrionaceae bacterium]
MAYNNHCATKKMFMLTVFLRGTIGIFLVVLIGYAHSSEEVSKGQERPISLSMFPGVSPLLLQQRFEKISLLLSKPLNQQVVFRTRKNYIEYFNAIKNEEFEIAIVSAFDYVRIRKNSRYIPILSRNDSSVTVLITTDEDIHYLDDLAGKRIGFPPKTAGASMMGRYLLTKNNLKPADYQSIFYTNHLSCIQAIINHNVDACFTGEKMLREVEKYKKMDYKILIESPKISQQLILIHPDLEDKVESIKDILLSLNETDEGREALEQAYLFVLGEFDDRQYDENERILHYMESEIDSNE